MLICAKTGSEDIDDYKGSRVSFSVFISVVMVLIALPDFLRRQVLSENYTFLFPSQMRDGIGLRLLVR